MELDALDRVRAVAHAHDLSVRGPCGHVELVGNADGSEGVVAAGLDLGRETLEDPESVVLEHARLAVQERLRARDLASERLDDRLVAEADSERRRRLA